MSRQRPEQSELTRGFADRLREVRSRRGMSAQQLADRCAELGVPSLNRASISTIESGRRAGVSIDEVFALAFALDTSPIYLLLPIEHDPDVHVTPTVVDTAGRVREWVRGQFPLRGQDMRLFHTEVPADEWQAMREAWEAMNSQDRLRAILESAGIRFEHHRPDGGE